MTTIPSDNQVSVTVVDLNAPASSKDITFKRQTGIKLVIGGMLSLGFDSASAQREKFRRVLCRFGPIGRKVEARFFSFDGSIRPSNGGTVA